MKLSNVKIVYFLGIGGIGMSALARYCNSIGKDVYGYDLTPSELTKQLEAEGMKIHFDDNPDKIPSKTELVVYTPAIPEDNNEYKTLVNSGIPMIKRSKMLGLLSAETFCIAVAGTHGKTSISSIIAHLLHSANKNVSALIGGIMNNYHSNVILSKNPDYLIVEADEFDRSFLNLSPDISIVSSIDKDHMDIYSDYDDLISAFSEFSLSTDKNGFSIINDSIAAEVSHNAIQLKYGLGKSTDYRAENIKIEDSCFVFDLVSPEMKIDKIKMQIPGRHYIENAMAASVVAIKSGLKAEEIKSGLESFAGVERRFSYLINNTETVYIDDYAHHPKEIESTLKAAKELYSDKEITVVFQPHLFSRTRDFAKEFAEALSLADEIILLDIYPAREKPIDGVNAELILNFIDKKKKIKLPKTELISYLKENKPQVLLSLGAGDIGLLTKEIENVLENVANS